MARILIIDDMPDVHRRLQSLLSGAGYSVDHADDSSEAKLLLGPNLDEDFNLIICDNNMRTANEGIEFAEEVMLRECKIPFLLHTSDPPSVLPKNWEKWGFHYLFKRSTDEEVLAKVRELVKK